MKTSSFVRFASAVLIALVAVSLVACAPTAVKTSPLAGTKWIAVSYNDGQSANALAKDTTITAQFGTDGKMSGNATINEYSASYSVDGQTIHIDKPTATKKAGPEQLMTQEAAYLGAIEEAATWRTLGNALDLVAADGALLVSLRSVR